MRTGCRGFLIGAALCVAFVSSTTTGGERCAEALWQAHAEAPPVPAERPVCDQRDTTFCSLFALATFLEHWGQNRDLRRGNRAPFPRLDVGYLAAAYNHDWSSGGGGHFEIQLLQTLFRHGVVPRAAKPYGDARRLRRVRRWRDRWAERHDAGIVSMKLLGDILDSRYRLPGEPDALTGVSYLRDRVGFDPRAFLWVESTHREPRIAADSSDDTPVEARYPEREEARRVKRNASKHDVPGDLVPVHPRHLLAAVASQLAALKPVLAGIYTDLTRAPFRAYRVVSSADLQARGDDGQHSVVLVAHCHELSLDDPLCRSFVDEMREKSLSDCFVLQNSWGIDAHRGGLVCIAPGALSRMLDSALLERRYLPD